MEKPKKTNRSDKELQDFRVQLDALAHAMDLLSRRVEDVMVELARIKESQNEVLAGLALWERGRRLKETLGVGPEPSEQEESLWDEIHAYCRNCTRMTRVSDPQTTFQDGRTTVTAKCRNCGTMVMRTLV